MKQAIGTVGRPIVLGRIALVGCIALNSSALGCGEPPAPAKDPSASMPSASPADDVDDEQDDEQDRRRRERLQDPMPAP